MKSIFFYLSTIALLFTAFSFSSCSGDAASADEFTPYISAYTGGIINGSSSIQIELVNEQPNIEPNTEVDKKLFSFSPSIKGKAYWVNNRTIEFVPEENQLKSGQSYNAAFKLGKILDVEKRFRVFNFTFYVTEKSFAIQVNPLTIIDSESVTVSGEIRFSDETELALVKKAFSATISDNQTLDYSVESTNDVNTFRFVINNIKRTKTDLDLLIRVEGKGLGINSAETKKVIIPDNTFKVLSAELISEPAEGVQLVFSDLVSTRQDLRGLIRIEEVSGINFQVTENKVNVYFSFENLTGVTLTVNSGVKNAKGENLTSDFETELIVEKLNPQVIITKSGNIIPTSEKLQLPFRAVNLNAVDIKIIQIFENNVLMFLQDNTLSGSDQLRRSGRLVYKKTLRLDSDPMKSLHNWQDYSIDLSNIMKQQPGAIYRIELSFKQAYSVYPCDGSNDTDNESKRISLSSNEITESEESYWDNPDSYYYDSYYTDDYTWEEYEWKERDNPCHKSYFMIAERKAVVNVMASNIGIIAKANDENTLWISVADIVDAKPISGAAVTVYNYQLQPIGTAQTDNDGFALVSPKGKAFVLAAESGGQKSYLRLVEGESNSLSRFDVGGKKIEKGLKGFIYGERGVWRPGDTLFVTFMLHDIEKRIPETHPVAFEMYNPQGQFYTKQVSTKGVNGFYSFKIPTKADDPTGLWNAYVKVGGASFHKSFRIETIKPNRLKINVDFGKDIINANENIPVTLASSWLTGATASNLKTEVEMTLSKTKTQFKGYEKFIFNNPATDFNSSEESVFSGTLNSEGAATFNLKTPTAENAPGMLNAAITARVFEQGGDASIFSQVVPFSPFSSYVGINLNQEEGKYIETDTEHTFDIVTLNAQGKPVNRNNLEYKIYRVGWSWWWEQSSESFSNYVNGSSYTPVAKGRLQTINGKTSFRFTLNYPEWGRYLVYVKDKDSGHAAGGLVYIDWPSWRGRSNKTDPNNIKMLSFTSDKQSYEIGENITVTIPKASGGRALVAIENGSTVLSRTWVQLNDAGDTKYTFEATKDMAPNFYVHISLLQPHAQTINDLPIRMYGVIPVFISNKNSVLEPQINMPDVLRPETEFTVQVSEKNGKPMTYTVAVVDDGLLDLTNFKTPNPWNEFFAREALGIRTWDMYDFVMGAFGGKFSSMFSIGGDEELKQGDAKANRFRPVVKYLGPFTLDAGKTNAHKIKLPMYVGSVRTMIVAGQDNAYGNAEKTTPVRAPLMILSSLPRVVSTGEEIMLPVNVFALESNVKNVSVKVETSEDLLQTTEGSVKTVTFSQPGDQMLYFPMKTIATSGVEKVTITATGGGNTTTETIEIDVRNPNPAIILSGNKLVDAGETTDFNYNVAGNANDDWVKIEAARIPPVDITRRFDFLYNYQHNCSEQLTSRALPLLYVAQFKDMDSQESEMIKKNVQEAIRTLYGRQLLNGGIVTWTGQSSANDWITSYAGIFLTLAKEKGYEVNDGVLNKWKSYQRREAQNWRPSTANNYYAGQSEYAQAFRLYSLALANAADLGAMNRMKEMQNLSTQARWQLAAAYAVNGKVSAAQELIFKEATYIKPYSYSYTFGSSDRDEAMILQTMILMDDMQNAFTQAQKVSENLSRENQFSTQSTAFSLTAMGMLAQKTSGDINFSWSLNGKKQDNVKSSKAVFQQELPKNTKGNISLTNNGKGLLYVNVVSKSKPVKDTLPEIANNLRIQVAYSDLNGNAIDIQNLKQGTDFVAEVKVTNISPTNDYTDLALTHIIPSGWEIFNERMIGDGNSGTSNTFTYQDIRDDRVLTYFDLPRNRSKVIKVRLQSSYIGSFVLPAVQCEAMYDTSAFAKTKAGSVKVVK